MFQVFSVVLAKINPQTIDLANQETRNLVKHVAQKNGLKCVDDDNDGGFVVNGSYEQIVAFHDYFVLTKNHSKESLGDKRKSDNVLSKTNKNESMDSTSKKWEWPKEKQSTIKSERQPMIKGEEKETASDKTTSAKLPKDNGQTDSSLQAIKIKPREWSVFAKTNKKELQQLMSAHGLLLKLSETACNVERNPSKECDEETLKAVSEKLGKMYNKAVEYMKCERFALTEENMQSKLRQLVLDFNKKESVVLERAPDRKSWEIFGVNAKVDDILRLLEAEVGITRLAATSDGDEEEVEEEISADEDEKVLEEEDDGDVIYDTRERLQHNLGRFSSNVYIIYLINTNNLSFMQSIRIMCSIHCSGTEPIGSL